MIEILTEHTIEPGLAAQETESAISQAVASIADTQNGGIVNLRSAEYRTENPIKITDYGVKLRGTGSTKWQVDNPVGPSISIGEDNLCVGEGEVSGIKFIAGCAKVSGTVMLVNAGQFTLKDLIFSAWDENHRFHDGIKFVSNRDDPELSRRGTPYQWIVRVKNVDMYGGQATGSALIYDQGVFDIFLDDMTIGGWTHSIDVRDCEGIFHTDIETTRSLSDDINIVAEDGKVIKNIFFNGVIPDWGLGHGYNIITNGSGEISTIYIERGWIGSRGAEYGTGAPIRRSHGIYANAPNLYGLYISGGRHIEWNNGHGICVLNGRKIRITDMNILSNGVWATTGHGGFPNMGVFIGGQAREVDILGGCIGKGKGPCGQLHGICIDNEVDIFHIQGVTSMGNIDKAIVYPGGKRCLVANNFTD